MRGDRAIAISLLLSIMIHAGIFLYLSKEKQEEKGEKIREITFVDMSYPPKAQKVIRHYVGKGGEINIASLFKAEKSQGVKKEIIPVPEKFEMEEPKLPERGLATPEIELKEKKPAVSQAVIDLNKYKSLPELPVEDVLALSGDEDEMKTTAEILREKPIDLEEEKFGGGTGFAFGETLPKKRKIDLEKLQAPEISQELGLAERMSVKKVKVEGKARSVLSVGGEIRDRKIVYKVLPEYPEWARKKGIAGTVVVRFIVTPEGNVKESSIIIESSSGYPGLDEAVVSALKKWKFEPLPTGVEQKAQWGIVIVKFVLK